MGLVSSFFVIRAGFSDALFSMLSCFLKDFSIGKSCGINVYRILLQELPGKVWDPAFFKDSRRFSS